MCGDPPNIPPNTRLTKYLTAKISKSDRMIAYCMVDNKTSETFNRSFYWYTCKRIVSCYICIPHLISKLRFTSLSRFLLYTHFTILPLWITYMHTYVIIWRLVSLQKCENAAICEKVAKCEKNSTLDVKIDAICEKIALNVKKWGSLNVSSISTLNVLKSTLYVQTLFWRYLWKSNFNACQISER